MEKNLGIAKNREWIIFSPKSKGNKSSPGPATVCKWGTKRRVTYHDTSVLDGLLVQVDNLLSLEKTVLLGELSMIEAFLPELLESLVNFQEE